jgi:hypothetical protein
MESVVQMQQMGQKRVDSKTERGTRRSYAVIGVIVVVVGAVAALVLRSYRPGSDISASDSVLTADKSAPSGPAADQERDRSTATGIAVSEPAPAVEGLAEAAFSKAIDAGPTVDPAFIWCGFIRNIQDAERIFSDLDRAHYELSQELAVYIPALKAFIEKSSTAKDRAKGKYLLLQASLLTRDIATAMDILDEFSKSDELSSVLEPEQQNAIAVSQLALSYLNPGSGHRLADYAQKVAGLEGVGRLGFELGDVATAFSNLASRQANLIDEFIATATLHYDVLRSDLRPEPESQAYREYYGIVKYGSGKTSGKLTSLYETGAFQDELAVLRETNLDKAWLIEFYALNAYTGKKNHARVYDRAMDLFRELPANHPYRPMFALLACRANSRTDARYAEVVQYVERGNVMDQDFARW